MTLPKFPYLLIFLIFVSMALSGLSVKIETLRPAPPKVQVVIYKKIFSYCKNLSKDGINVAVLTDESNPDFEEIIRGFTNLGIPVVELKNDKFQTQSKITVLYVSKSSKSIVSHCNNRGVLCISATPEDVQENLAAISIYSENNKPKIIINMSVLKSQNHEISSEVLKLATIVGE